MSEDLPANLADEKLLRLLLARMDPSLADLSSEQVYARLAAQRTGRPAAPAPRWQDKLIEEQIPHGASVLDLGCGNGELLARLRHSKQVRGQGIELDAEAVFQCVERGVPVLQADLDRGLKGFADQSFDVVVLEETLQTLHQPIAVLQEMLRVGHRGIVSFPNFAYWRVRLDLVIRGRMPVTEWLPYHWYDTPNIHNFTLQDFLDWARTAGVRIVEGHVLAEGALRLLREGDNLYAEEILLVVERAAGPGL